MLWTLTSPGSASAGTAEAFRQPSELRSTDGLLQLRLEAARGLVALAGLTVTANTYNGGIPGPTLRVKPGDRLRVSFHNGLDEATNLHVHGLHVSPAGNGDNPFVSVAPGESFDYEYQLPADHPPGLYWYHPHHHGSVADQVFGGLYGAILVEDLEAIENARERILVISDTTLDAFGSVAEVSSMQQMLGREGQLVLVNGQLGPQLEARPAERERWRILNACVSRYVALRLDGQQMQLLARDSGRLASPEVADEVLLAPGNRADVLVTMSDGVSVLESVPYDRGDPGGMMGGMMGGSAPSTDRIPLATLTVDGDPVAASTRIPAASESRDLRASDVVTQRELTLAMGMGGGMDGGSMMSFTIDGREFDPDRIDTVVAAGSVEEWTITNTSSMDHPVHLHVWPMQVVEIDERSIDMIRWQDVVNVPARGRAKVRIAFDDFTGRSVYHCHILDHEDLGMMGVIEVR